MMDEWAQDIHERIVRQAPLDETLDAVARWLKVLMPGVTVAFMRFDPGRQTLSLCPSRYFSPAYQQRLQDVPIGDVAGSFGSAAWQRQPQFTEDITTDPSWADLRAAAEAEGLRACWSVPATAADGELLAVFSLYFRRPSRPDASSRRRLRQATALVALAFIRERDAFSYRTLGEWHRSLFDNHPDGVYELDLEGRFQRCNAALSRILGYAEDDMVGRHFNELVVPEYRATTQAGFDIARGGGSHQYETVGVRRDGRSVCLEIWNFPVSVDGRVVGVYGTCRDITRQREQEDQLAWQATHDVLTGLPNRTTFDEHLGRAFARSRRDGKPLVVMLLDLDGFKAINEGLGYHVGNQLLVAVAERLSRAVGDDGMLARLTGDEFALFAPALADTRAANALAARVLEALSASLRIEDKLLHISASIGIAANDSDLEQAHELKQRADIAMTAAKQRGRNTWHWYEGDVQRITEDAVLLRHDLHTALGEDQFELYYQPIVEAMSGRIRGVEALIRWHHPEKGMISPGVFIPLAEQTGQIISLGLWSLRRACKDAAARRAAGGPCVPVAVNISSLQFRRGGFVEDVRQALDDSGLPASLLELEVTESVLLDGAEKAVELINRLKAMGIRVALDDFGTGFSSLSYLRDLPIHKVKLDRAFIRNILTDRSNAAIVQGIITMAHRLDLVVVAEGIEEPAQQQDLVRRHADLLQGFFFARPMPQRDLLALPEKLPADS